MSRKSDHEDEALQAFCDELAARGRSAKLVCHPDRDTAHPLSVDAIIDVGGRQWAVDHLLVSRPASLPAAMAQAERSLRERLEEVASSNGCKLFVSYLPQSAAMGTPWGVGYYDDLVRLAQTAATTREMTAGDDGFAMVQPVLGGEPAVFLTPFTDTTGNPLIGAQVEAGLRDPLLKKLTGQLRRAKDAGLPTALLLDQNPRPGGHSHTVWNAGPTTIAAVTQRIVDSQPGVLDQVWLRPALRPSPLTSPHLHLLLAQ